MKVFSIKILPTFCISIGDLFQVGNPIVNNVDGTTTCSFVVDAILSAATPSGAKTYDLATEKYFVLVSRGPINGERLTQHVTRTPSTDPVSFAAVTLVTGSDGWLIQVGLVSCTRYMLMFYS